MYSSALPCSILGERRRCSKFTQGKMERRCLRGGEVEIVLLL